MQYFLDVSAINRDRKRRAALRSSFLIGRFLLAAALSVAAGLGLGAFIATVIASL
jgi:hypothetical protein